MPKKLEPVLIGFALLALLLFVGYEAHPQSTRGEHYFPSLLITSSAVALGMLTGSFASSVETGGRRYLQNHR